MTGHINEGDWRRLSRREEHQLTASVSRHTYCTLLSRLADHPRLVSLVFALAAINNCGQPERGVWSGVQSV